MFECIIKLLINPFLIKSRFVFHLIVRSFYNFALQTAPVKLFYPQNKRVHEIIRIYIYSVDLLTIILKISLTLKLPID